MDLFYENGNLAAGIFIGFALTANYYELRKFAAAKRIPIKFSLMNAIIAMWTPLAYMCLPFLAIYRQIVKIILSMIHASKFGGILPGVDYFVNMQFKSAIPVIFIVKYKTNSSRSFCDTVKESMRKSLLGGFRDNPKSFGIMQESLGYSYILRDGVTFDDCFKTLRKVDSPNGEITKADFNKLLDEISDMPLPKDSKAFWDAFVGTQHINWKTNVENGSIKYYPVVVRFNHALADGAHFIKGVIGLSADKDVMEYKNNIKLHNQLKGSNSENNKRDPSSVHDFFKDIGNKLKYYMELCFAAIVSPGVVYVVLLSMTAQVNPGPTLQNEYIQRYRVEESPHYIPIVKRIRRKFPNSSFEDIIRTALAASLGSYFKRNSKPIPEYLQMPTGSDLNFKNIMESPSKGRKIFCDNVALAKLSVLPVGLASEGTYASLVQTLEFVKNERILSANTAESIVYRFVNDILLQLLPNFLRDVYLKQIEQYPLLLTSIPGPHYFTVLGGCPIEDIVGFPPYPPGFGTAFLSYDDRQQVAMTVDKAWVSDENEIQDLIDGIYKAIDLLDNENLQEKM